MNVTTMVLVVVKVVVGVETVNFVEVATDFRDVEVTVCVEVLIQSIAQYLRLVFMFHFEMK